MTKLTSRLVVIIFWVIILCVFTSCEKELIPIPPETDYQFKMTGRTYQDSNNYYHLTLDPDSLKQTLHRFGAYITNVDQFNLPSKVIWRSDSFWYLPDTLGYTYIEIGNVPTGEHPWSWENFAVTGYEGMTVPIVNGTSYADPIVDSAFCMMAPIGAMIGDTITIYGQAWFEEGDIILEDSFQIIFD
jgi:hypothetical protein